MINLMITIWESKKMRQDKLFLHAPKPKLDPCCVLYMPMFYT